MEMRTANVNTGLIDVLWKVRISGIPVDTRNGAALRYPEPVMITYLNPQERVLMLPERDANPYFHLMECLWMMSGRKDVKWIAQFNKRMPEFSDDMEEFHGAYGHRWRYNFGGMDQLGHIINILTKDPGTRRAVLTMWDPTRDLNVESLDLPCNTHIYFDIVEGRLNMTVCNRSNDLVWGMMGANAVHMSFLQEVIAAAVGVEIGTYTQFTNNLHLYLDQGQGRDLLYSLPTSTYDPYWNGRMKSFSIVDTPSTWFLELESFMSEEDRVLDLWDNSFFPKIAIPMWESWFARKEGRGSGLEELEDMIDCDWKQACINWIERRIK